MIFELRGDDRDGTKAVASSEYRERGVRNDSVVYGVSERQGKERGTFSGGGFGGGAVKSGFTSRSQVYGTTSGSGRGISSDTRACFI